MNELRECEREEKTESIYVVSHVACLQSKCSRGVLRRSAPNAKARQTEENDIPGKHFFSRRERRQKERESTLLLSRSQNICLHNWTNEKRSISLHWLDAPVRGYRISTDSRERERRMRICECISGYVV